MTSNHCPQCGLPLEDERPCPACLLEFAAETDLFSSAVPEIDIDLIREAAFPQLEIVEMVGRGGMGTVFKARQPKLDRYVALKILSPPHHLAGTPAHPAPAHFAERFAREGKLLARLSHPNIVAVYDFGQTEVTLPGSEEPVTFFYLTMEYVDGVDLRRAMREERFSPEQALAIVPKICDALQYAHEEGVLHRDIKPENILLDVKGRVKIADFGIASAARWTEEDSTASDATPATADPDERQLTLDGQILGTPNYMAPEQFEGAGRVDARADIYSLGVVFYELLTGELPKGDFPKPSEKTPVDSEIDHIVQKALDKNRESRYQSAEEFKTDVYHTVYVLNHKEKEKTEAVRSDDEDLHRDRRRRMMMFWLLIAALVGGIVFFAVNDPPPERIDPRERFAGRIAATSDDPEAAQGPSVDAEFLEETRRRMTMAWIVVIGLVVIIFVQYHRRRYHRQRTGDAGGTPP